MCDLILEFPEQLLESIEISKQYNIQLNKDPQKVVIYGVRESEIAAEIIRGWLHFDCFVSIDVCSDYQLPHFTDENTLIIFCFSGGNDKGVLSAFEQALNIGAMVIGISVEGELLDVLSEKNLPVIRIPNHLPVNQMLAYPLVQLASIFDNLKLSPTLLIPQIEESIPFIKKNQDFIVSRAAHLITQIGDKQIAFSFEEEHLRPVSLRVAHQINENGKELEVIKVIPEVYGSEIFGHKGSSDNLFEICLSGQNRFGRNEEISAFIQGLIPSKMKGVTNIAADGANDIQETLYLIHMFDWVSLFVADNKSIKPV